MGEFKCAQCGADVYISKNYEAWARKNPEKLLCKACKEGGGVEEKQSKTTTTSSSGGKVTAALMRKYYDEIMAEFQDEVERGFLNGEDIRAMMNTLIINAEGKKK